MYAIDEFLQEDMLIVRPSIYLYIDRSQIQKALDVGIQLDKDYISCYLKRIPELPHYKDFLDNTCTLRLTLQKLQKIKDQKVSLKAVKISDVPDGKIDNFDIIPKLQRKYDSYLNVCFNDKIPLEDMPHIDLYLSDRFLPVFVCKALN